MSRAVWSYAQTLFFVCLQKQIIFQLITSLLKLFKLLSMKTQILRMPSAVLDSGYEDFRANMAGIECLPCEPFQIHDAVRNIKAEAFDTFSTTRCKTHFATPQPVGRNAWDVSSSLYFTYVIKLSFLFFLRNRLKTNFNKILELARDLQKQLKWNRFEASCS